MSILGKPCGKRCADKVRYDYEKISALTKQAKQRVWPNQALSAKQSECVLLASQLIFQVLFNLGGHEAWGHETIMPRTCPRHLMLADLSETASDSGGLVAPQ